MAGNAAYAEIEAAFSGNATRALPLALDDAQRQELRAFWIGRATGELTTALSFEFMLEDLQALSAPDALTSLATRTITDEHRHVDWCLRFADLLGEDEAARAHLGGTRPLELDGASAEDNRVLRTVFGCCFSETVAVHVLRASHQKLALDSVSRLNRQHLAEEVQHARLGWALLAWPGLSMHRRSMIAAFVPTMAELTRRVWLAPNRPDNAHLQEFGYLSNPLIEQACQRAFDEVIYPGLEENGIAV